MSTSANFFTQLGQTVARELASPSGRQRLSNTLRSTLNNHVSRPMARDAMPTSLRPRQAKDQESVDPDLMPRGGYNEQEVAAVVDPLELVSMIKHAIDSLDPESKEVVLAGLCQILDEDAVGNTVDPTNTGALDRGRRSAKDVETTQGMPTSGRYSQTAQDRKRLAAQDSALTSLNHRGFEQRWGELTKDIDNWGRR